ncbi:MAG TPA: rhodanese-like domain-containing protein [Verrucomicrobiae bacterium]|nr:rhodanese-like domain-containing protein [Verrucomicrobiae bacterium]
MRNVLLEALLVAGGAAVLAFAANALSPRGLSLGHDYFPRGALTNSVLAQPAAQGSSTGAPATVLDQVVAQGVHLADGKEAQALFHDPGFLQGQVAFVDARAPEEYQAGHIPGAYEFDRFHPENYMGTVLPVCQFARQVMVYCNGGTCEDSAFAAMFLLSAGVPKEKLLVYPGGISQWSTNGLPIETGERDSGRFLEVKR